MDYRESTATSFLNSTVNQHGSHMVMTNVQKQTKTKIVNIDTRFVDEYQVNTNIYPITLSDKITHVKSIKVVSAEIPISYYPISAALGNNYFMVTNNQYRLPSTGSVNPKTFIITLPDGNYTIVTAIAEVNRQFHAYVDPDDSGYKYNLEFATTNNTNIIIVLKMGGDNGNPYDLQFDFAVNQNGEFDKYNFKSKLGWLLGFRNTTYRFRGTYDTDKYTILLPTTEAFVNLSMRVQRYLYLVIDEFNNGPQNSFLSSLPTSLINKNIIARICPNVGFGEVVYANCGNGLLYSDCRSYTSKFDIQRLGIQLINEIGQPIHLNGLDFSFCMEIEYE